MRACARRLWVFAMAVFPVGACSEIATPPPDTVQLRLAAKENFEQTPLEGAKVCQGEAQPPNCVTTNADGVATLELPANQKLSYTVENEGYESLLYPILTGMAESDAVRESNMFSDAWVADNFAKLQAPYPMTDRGMIHMIIVPRFAGVTFELVDATGKAWYKTEVDDWSPDLEATTGGGIGTERCCAEGGFVEVVPGDYQVEIGGTAQGCILSLYGSLVGGWPGDAPNRALVPVRSGFSTRTVLLCAEAP